MTVLMEEAVERLRSVTEDRQDAVARLVLLVADAEQADDLTAEDLRAIERSRVAASRGEFASDGEMAEIWAKHGR